MSLEYAASPRAIIFEKVLVLLPHNTRAFIRCAEHGV